VLEVEGQDRRVKPLGDGHHRSVDESEVERGVSRVDLESAPEERVRQRDATMGAGGEVRQESPGGGAPPTPAHEPVCLDRDGLGDEELASEACDERRGELMRFVLSRDRRQQRPGVDDYVRRLPTAASASST